MSWLKAKDCATSVEYSSLFHSGLRAISRRPRAHRARAYSSSSSSQEKSSNEETSSKVPLSSRFLSRSVARTCQASPATSESPDLSPAPPSHAPKGTRPRPSSMFVRSTKETTDGWSSGERFLDIGDYPKFREEESCHAGYLVPQIEIGTLRSLTGSPSFFVNLGEVDGAAVPQRGEDSFLLPSMDQDALQPRRVPRRERPVSMQTMPLPSRRSSAHYRTRETRRGDCAWMLEESSPELKTHELELEDEEKEAFRPDDERSDVADWRQFHVDWLETIR